MSRIINLNDKISCNNDFRFYCLDSHFELTFILEYLGELIYANIYNVMVTHDLSKKYKDNIIVSDVIGQVKDILENNNNE